MSGDECVECGSENDLHQHHTSYAENETVWLCSSCHGTVHQDESHELYPDYEIERHDNHRTTINVPKAEHRDAKAVKEKFGDTWTDVLEFYTKHRHELSLNGQGDRPTQDIDTLGFDDVQQACRGAIRKELPDRVLRE